MMLVLCGVSGVGKTTVGRLLSEALDMPFHDADDYHPPSNRDKMTNGIPLNDGDRRPWLEALAGQLPVWERKGGAVLACSALKEAHRAVLASRCGEHLRWVVLHADEAVLADRLEARDGHFFGRDLLGSQLDAFEMPDYGWCVNVQRASPREVVNEILTRLRKQ